MNIGVIRTGIGGWTFEPWRGSFYPADLPKTRELNYAAKQLRTIEINGTFYRTQTPRTFAKWREAVPEGFVFSVKALRYTVMKKKLAEAADSIDRFLHSGLTELGDALGPILWQFMETRRFDPEDIAAFLEMLPATLDGVPLRHALEVRHESFACRDFVDLARKHGVAIVVADHPSHPQIADLTGSFVYARLMQTREEVATGYDDAQLDRWADIAGNWAKGERPNGLDYVSDAPADGQPRDVFAYFIAGAKARNPAAAMALAERCT